MSGDEFLSFGKRERTVPLAPMPSIAILMTINPKWYQSEMEKSLVRAISNARDVEEKRKIAASTLPYAIGPSGQYPNPCQ